MSNLRPGTRFHLITCVGGKPSWEEFDRSVPARLHHLGYRDDALTMSEEFVEHGELGSFVKLPESEALLFRTK